MRGTEIKLMQPNITTQKVITIAEEAGKIILIYAGNILSLLRAIPVFWIRY